MPRILLVILVLLTALIFLAVSSRGRLRGDLVLPNGLVPALGLAAGFAPFLWPILAGSWAGGEYGWGTIRISLTKMPNRILFNLSGLTMVLLTIGLGLVLVLGVGAVMGSLVSAINNTSATPAPPGVSATAVIIKMFFAAWFLSAFYATLAYAVGVLFRSVPAGIGIGIGFSVVQSLTAAIFTGLGDPWKTIAAHFPDGYSEALTSRLSSELIRSGAFSKVSSTAPGIPQSIAGLAIYIAILLAVMLVLVQVRDINA